nr:hypothetical protein CFP56_04871 [Quercus suber]
MQFGLDQDIPDDLSFLMESPTSDEEKKGWYWHIGDYPPGWEKKVKVINVPAPAKKGPTKLKSASKPKSATPRPPTDATLASRIRGSKRKTTPYPAFAAKWRSKHKEDTSATGPIVLDEPELEDEPKPLSIYRPISEELSASMGTPMEGFFDGANEVTPTPAETTSIQRGATPPTATQIKTTLVTPLVISIGDPFAALSQSVKESSSLVVTPSSIPISATCGPNANLSSKESEDILEDPKDKPILGGGFLNPKKRRVLHPRLNSWVSLVSAVPSMPVFVLPKAPIITGPGPLLTVPSQFEVGSSSATIPNHVSEATAFFAHFDQPEVNDLGPADF